MCTLRICAPIAAFAIVALLRPIPISVAADEPRPTTKAPSFKEDVKPILAANCTSCHGTVKRKAGIDLQTYSTVMKTVKAGEPDASRLVKSLQGKGAKPMPPKRPLDGKDIDLIKSWIAAGAKDN